MFGERVFLSKNDLAKLPGVRLNSSDRSEEPSPSTEAGPSAEPSMLDKDIPTPQASRSRSRERISVSREKSAGINSPSDPPVEVSPVRKKSRSRNPKPRIDDADSRASRSRTREPSSKRSLNSVEPWLKGFKSAQARALRRVTPFERPDVSLQGQIFHRQNVIQESDPVSRLVAKHQYVQPDLSMNDLDAMKRTGMTPKRLWFTKTYEHFAKQTSDSLDHIIFGQPARIVGGKTEVGKLSWDKILCTTLVDKSKWPGFQVPNLATNLRRAQDDSILAVSANRNVNETVLGIMQRLVAEFIIASQETKRLTSILPHFLELVPTEHRNMFERIQFDLLRISKACAESTERFVLLQECSCQSDNAVVVARLKELRTKWRKRMQEFPLVDSVDDRESSACRFRTEMAPGPANASTKKFTGLVKVCRPSVQNLWKWGGKNTSTSTTSGSKPQANTPSNTVAKTSSKTCTQCGSKKHTKDSCPQISSNAKRMNAARGRGKGKRGRGGRGRGGRGKGKKRKFEDS